MIFSAVELLPVTRQSILRMLKLRGAVTTAEVARELGMTHEGARKHMLELLRDGWVMADCPDPDQDVAPPSVGRPPVRYCLTVAGDHFFEKAYDVLLAALIRLAAEDGSLPDLLTRITDARVEGLRTRVEGKPLPRRVRVLESIYINGDDYMEVERDGTDYLLIERNCPFLNVALREPAICSTTVSTLRRLTGHRVVRERRFQNGDGRCVFRILGREVAPGDGVPFEPEPDPPPLTNS